jgi:threonine aldolase
VAEARILRKRLGGGMRQAGILAAAGRYALAHHLPRLAEDHARAARLADGLGVAAPETNTVVLDVADAVGLAEAARREGILVGVVGPHRLRLVTHLDVDDAGLGRAREVLAKLLADA